MRSWVLWTISMMMVATLVYSDSIKDAVSTLPVLDSFKVTPVKLGPAHVSEGRSPTRYSSRTYHS
ncbi:hypothetical protein AB1K70_15445 [Bremerella sp. JC770]|uniref:hypothetical protein n=1 Tax=Bremerella sp. JC770 TaxID=3232137 RepID=UPI003458E034